MPFLNHGFFSSGFLNLSAREAYKEATENNALILDVREFRLAGHKRFDVPNVVNITNSTLAENYGSLPMKVPIIVADTVGLHSYEAMKFLLNKGYSDIANLAGGIVDWERERFPIIKDLKEQLSGSCLCQLMPRQKLKE